MGTKWQQSELCFHYFTAVRTSRQAHWRHGIGQPDDTLTALEKRPRRRHLASDVSHSHQSSYTNIHHTGYPTTTHIAPVIPRQHTSHRSSHDNTHRTSHPATSHIAPVTLQQHTSHQSSHNNTHRTQHTSHQSPCNNTHRTSHPTTTHIAPVILQQHNVA